MTPRPNQMIIHLLQWPLTHSHRWSSRIHRQWPLIHLTLLKGQTPKGGSRRSGGFGGRGGLRLCIGGSPKRFGIPSKVCLASRSAEAMQASDSPWSAPPIKGNVRKAMHKPEDGSSLAMLPRNGTAHQYLGSPGTGNAGMYWPSLRPAALCAAGHVGKTACGNSRQARCPSAAQPPQNERALLGPPWALNGKRLGARAMFGERRGSGRKYLRRPAEALGKRCEHASTPRRQCTSVQNCASIFRVF